MDYVSKVDNFINKFLDDIYRNFTHPEIREIWHRLWTLNMEVGMISDVCIQDKDFSIELPAIIAKLELASEGLSSITPLIDGEGHHIKTIDGAVWVLDDVTLDLEKINQALYPSPKGGSHARE